MGVYQNQNQTKHLFGLGFGTLTAPNIFCICFFGSVPNRAPRLVHCTTKRKQDSNCKQDSYPRNPTTARISTNLATSSSEQPWRSFWMQTTINHSYNGLLNTEILIFHVLHSLQSCRLLSSGSNSQFHSKCPQGGWAIQASEWRFRLQKRPDFTRKMWRRE
jgi:hypothetical protein